MKVFKIHPPRKGDHIDVWVNNTWQTIQRNLHIDKRGQLSGNDILLEIGNFPPECYPFYQQLQQKISEHLTEEFRRPSICLDIRGAKRIGDSSPAEFGYIGGTGPLSDAAALENIMERYQEVSNLENFHAVLFSFPPPRPGPESKRDTLKHGYHYIHELRRLTREYPCQQHCLVSNTAHLRAKTAQKMILPGKRSLVHLVNAISDKIAAENPASKKVLVLGTIVAANNNLYPKILEKRGVSGYLPEKSRGVRLQELIDQIKGGKVNARVDSSKPETYGDKLVDFILEEVDIQIRSGHQITHILLSCTELPMGLHAEKDGKSYLTILNEKLIAKGIHAEFIDTEAEMAAIITSHQYQNTRIKQVMEFLSSHKADLSQNNPEFFADLIKNYRIIDVCLAVETIITDKHTKQAFSQNFLDFQLKNITLVQDYQARLIHEDEKSSGIHKSPKELAAEEILLGMEFILFSTPWNDGRKVINPYTEKLNQIPERFLPILTEINKAKRGAQSWEASLNAIHKIGAVEQKERKSETSHLQNRFSLFLRNDMHKAYKSHVEKHQSKAMDLLSTTLAEVKKYEGKLAELFNDEKQKNAIFQVLGIKEKDQPNQISFWVKCDEQKGATPIAPTVTIPTSSKTDSRDSVASESATTATGTKVETTDVSTSSPKAGEEIQYKTSLTEALQKKFLELQSEQTSSVTMGMS